MRTKALAAIFIIIISAGFLLNIGNASKAIQPVIDKYIHGKSIEDADTAKEMIELVESGYNDGFARKTDFVELYGLTKRMIGSNQIDIVVRLKNRYLTYLYYEIDRKQYSRSIKKLDRALKKQDKQFLYVAAPYKNYPYDDNRSLPVGLQEEDFGNANEDRLLERLEKAGVNTMDLRPLLREHQPDWYSAFFVTDHHWKPETAFWAYTKVADRLHQDYGYGVDERSMDLANYQIDLYKDRFLGSQGRKTGRLYAGTDDFPLIYPKFHTDMTVRVPNHKEVRKGSYYDVMFKTENLKKDYYNINTYVTYTGGDYPLCTFHNDAAVNEQKLMILKDSFSLPFQPYLSFLFRDVISVDLRESVGQKKKLSYYLEKYDPDLVMMFYAPSTMPFPEAFQVDE